jgi:hypothetical protein
MRNGAIGKSGECDAPDENEDPPSVAQTSIGVEENGFQGCVLAGESSMGV